MGRQYIDRKSAGSAAFGAAGGSSTHHGFGRCHHRKMHTRMSFEEIPASSDTGRECGAAEGSPGNAGVCPGAPYPESGIYLHTGAFRQSAGAEAGPDCLRDVRGSACPDRCRRRHTWEGQCCPCDRRIRDDLRQSVRRTRHSQCCTV